MGSAKELVWLESYISMCTNMSGQAQHAGANLFAFILKKVIKHIFIILVCWNDKFYDKNHQLSLI